MNRYVCIDFIQEISKMPLNLYFSYIFTFNTVLEKISRTIFLKNKRILLFDGSIVL